VPSMMTSSVRVYMCVHVHSHNIYVVYMHICICSVCVCMVYMHICICSVCVCFYVCVRARSCVSACVLDLYEVEEKARDIYIYI
jgi:ABC-type transport system involved in cytochrome c biogenesis permease component